MTGLPARATVSESPPLDDLIVSATSTVSESETESADSVTVSTVETSVVNSVSAAARVRIDSGFQTRRSDRATSRPVWPGPVTTGQPVRLSRAVRMRAVAAVGQTRVAA